MLGYIRGRESRSSSRVWVVIKTLCQTVVFWAIFLWALPALLFFLESSLGLGGWRFATDAAAWLGGFLFAAGGLLGITSGMVMAIVGRGTPLPADCPPMLVIAGPYAYIRNPMALAGLAQGVAVGLYLGSPAVIAYAIVGGPIWHIFVRPWEEADLVRRFGEPYRRYREQVKCWWPRFTPYSVEAAH